MELQVRRLAYSAPASVPRGSIAVAAALAVAAASGVAHAAAVASVDAASAAAVVTAAAAAPFSLVLSSMSASSCIAQLDFG